MKKLKYFLSGNSVEIPWSETSETIAKTEADNGQYTVEDDEQPDPSPNPQEDIDAMLVDHEFRLTMLELGI